MNVSEKWGKRETMYAMSHAVNGRFYYQRSARDLPILTLRVT